MMVFLMMKVLECLRAMEEVYFGLKRPVIILLSTLEFIVTFFEEVTIEEVGFGLKIPDNIHLSIMEEVLVGIGEVDKGIRPANLSTITQVVST